MGVPKRMTTVALAAAALCVAGGLTPLGQTATAADACSGGVSSDFNGDGAADTVIADPQATVDGATRAGLVRVVLGAGKGVVEVSEAAAGMGATPERGDEFGFSRAVYDVDQDGCSDLVVGAPYEDVPHDGQELIDAGGSGSSTELPRASVRAHQSTATPRRNWTQHRRARPTTGSGMRSRRVTPPAATPI